MLCFEDDYLYTTLYNVRFAYAAMPKMALLFVIFLQKFLQKLCLILIFIYRVKSWP